ncbi:hypothetical protein EVAR_34243_1 [Eumeta japonica]|uniref:Uncharacterized protein n=1 Tax=Eumeta variegata TaxID=151549 RepID=A0A4C1SB54_EUMVA|nr:hypothetical protein EVAR_34243_1 [Eumeta japonica]
MWMSQETVCLNYVHASVVSGFLAVAAINDGQGSFRLLYSAELHNDGWLATVSDALVFLPAKGKAKSIMDSPCAGRTGWSDSRTKTPEALRRLPLVRRLQARGILLYLSGQKAQGANGAKEPSGLPPT